MSLFVPDSVPKHSELLISCHLKFTVKTKDEALTDHTTVLCLHNTKLPDFFHYVWKSKAQNAQAPVFTNTDISFLILWAVTNLFTFFLSLYRRQSLLFGLVRVAFITHVMMYYCNSADCVNLFCARERRKRWEPTPRWRCGFLIGLETKTGREKASQLRAGLCWVLKSWHLYRTAEKRGEGTTWESMGKPIERWGAAWMYHPMWSEEYFVCIFVFVRFSVFCYVCFLGGLLCFGVLFFGVFLVFWYLGTPQEVEAMCADRKKFESETDGELLNVAVYMGNDQIYHMRFISTL